MDKKINIRTKNITEADYTLVHALIVEAYQESEKEIRLPKYVRLNKEEFDNKRKESVFTVAFIDNIPVGSINHYAINDKCYGFSLLATKSDYHGKGIASMLIQEIEKVASSKGYQYMQIEILHPMDIILEGKEQLKKWYVSKGYELSHREDFKDVHPINAERLLMPCWFDEYVKKLK